MNIVHKLSKLGEPRGTMKRLVRIGEGATAEVYLSLFTRGYKRTVFVVKEIFIEDDRVLCRGDKDLRGTPHKDLEFGGTKEVHYTLQSHSKDGAVQVCRASSWKVECVVSHALRFVNNHLPSPVFNIIHDAWTTRRKRYTVMPFAGTTLCDLALPPKKFQSVVLQVLVALAWAQYTSHFKHHDLHSENVFVSDRTVPNVWPLPDGACIRLPDATVSARIADYGQSSITFHKTRFTRIDVHELDLNSLKWGAWNSILEGNEGYDMAVFLYSLEDDCMDNETDNLQFVHFLQQVAKSIRPYKMSKYGRPYGKIGVTIVDVLSHPRVQAFFDHASTHPCPVNGVCSLADASTV